MGFQNTAGEQFKTTRTAARRVLVVDDHRDSANLLAKLLTKAGHETKVAYDGLEAIEAAEQWRPQVVLLNIGMPTLDGHEAARRIRRQPWGQNMLLFAVTSDGRAEDFQKSKGAGFDRHLVKPLDCNFLFELLTDGSSVVVANWPQVE